MWLFAALASSQLANESPFSPSELQRLSAGELVTRPSSEERGSFQLMGGTSWQVIDAEPEAVYQALLDTMSYKHMLPAVTGARLVAQGQGYRVVRLEHKKGPFAVSYDVRASVDPDRQDISFSLAEAPRGAPRAAWGFFSVRPYHTGSTLLSYGIMTDPGDGILVGLLRGLVHEWILRVPRQVKSWVESKSGRQLYR